MQSLANWCFEWGIREAVISPGSRSAPLSIALARHKGIKKYIVPDERSAAFIAMGLSLAHHRRPVLICCTSGTATLNYLPALAEAYHQAVPLLVFTADRPAEWIGQGEGQTIPQQNMYAPFVKDSFTFPLMNSKNHKDKAWHAYRIIQDALQSAFSDPHMPVHV
ncbi:MAG: thiamine pyrophosphate-binding protein, partial [Cytophagales bacterium]|nr:thiamine pyrophosphate-binding protein [Cytophagales bacterium]